MKGIVGKIISVGAVVVVAGLLFAAAQERPSAAKPVVRAKFTPDSIAIGDHFKLEVTVDKDVMQGIAFPDFEDGMFNEVVEILGEGGVDTVAMDGRNVTLKKEYLLTTFEDGHLGMGHFPMLYLDKNVTDTIFSQDSLFIKVATFEIDTATMQIYDIKAPVGVPRHPYEYLGYIAGVILLALLVWLIVRYIAMRKRRGAGVVRKPSEPPHIVAIRALENIHHQKLWHKGRYKLYYTSITDVLREYIEERYGVQAMEMTSEEIVSALDGMEVPQKNYKALTELLSTADLVKFAKYEPDAEFNEEAYQSAYYFVEATKQAIIAGEEEAGKEAEQ